MVPKLHFPTYLSFYSFFTFFFLFFCSIDGNAQCAGTDNTLTVCDITNSTSQNIDLNILLGVHTAGGTWKDDDKSGGLNKTTGILNAQQIKKSGVYRYTYVVTGVSGCVDDNATITVTIGGYTGVPAPSVSICSSDQAYNLFQVFQGIPNLAPQIGGTWTDNDGSGGLSDNILNASIPISDDTYSYTYTIPAIGLCPAPPPSQIFVSIYRSPESGTPSDLLLCSNQLSTYTNFDLNNQLTGEDIDGIWTESSTSEINSDIDSTIDIQNIYNTKGPGTYSFTYTVISNNTVCEKKSSVVNIIIEKQLDFTDATLVINSDICETEIPTATYNAILTQGPQAIPNGTYEVTYSISGVVAPIKTTQFFVGGILTFPISSVYFQQVNDYTITIVSIKDMASLGICTNIMGTIEDILHVYPIPKINNATLTIAPVCENTDALVDFSGTSNLTDGNYDILYNLSGSNSATAIATVLTITGGLGSFTIPKALIPKAGTSTIAITKITNSTTGCTNSATLSKSFTINPPPDTTNLAVTIKNTCQGQAANVKLSGLGTLTAISINYNLSGINVVGNQTLPLTVVAGEVSFVISATDLPNVGLTTFTLTDITNTVTGCSLVVNKSIDFTVNPLPNIPMAIDQKFCSSDNATVANLIPQGSQYRWFDSATGTVPLIGTTPLITGNYYVKEVNATTGCESSLKMIGVLINSTPQINNATLTIASVCQGFNLNVNFSGTSNLTDGNYNILYNLSGSNTATGIPTVLSVTGGQASFSINSGLVPNSGNTTIAITNITNALTNCSNTSTLSKSFVINALPDVSNMIVTIKDGCLGQPVNVDITGLGTLTNISLNYAVTGANAISAQTISLVASAGKASFVIPAANLLNTGNNTMAITNLTNTGNSCSVTINSVSKNFMINAIPNNPTASNQKFCETSLATVANLTPNGNQYKWYDSPSNSAPLASNALLVTANYYVKEVNQTTGCESGATTVSVHINTVPVPVLNTNGQNFCGVNKPTIQNLSNNTNSSASITWYDAATSGTAFAKTDLLTEGTTYYGFNYDMITNCTSNPLSVTVTLTNCTATPENFKIADGFSPNGDGVNDTFQIIDIEFLFPNYTLEIFNRYGNLMFKGDINKPAWDGKNSNSSFISGDAPTGVYFYIIRYNKDNLAPKQGQLYLNR